MLAALALAAWLAAAAPAVAGSLPAASSGERPGPSLLYEPSPEVPELSVELPFKAKPLLVSGTDAYRDGEYLYQDYLFDDRGADTVPGGGRQRETGSFAPTAGDVLYPTAERFAGNAADLAEIRVKPTTRHLVYRVTLNSVVDEDTTVVGIGIDMDRSGGSPVAWPRGAGVSSPGLDAFITAWGTGGEVRSLPGGEPEELSEERVEMNPRTNQMTIRVPRRTGIDPGRRSVWRHVAGAGLFTGDASSGPAWKPVPAAAQPDAQTPASGNPARPAPAVLNLGFRFDEPQSNGGMQPYTTSPGIGNWFEEQQARALAEGTTDCSFAGAPSDCKPLHADVDFAALAADAHRFSHPPRREQARIMPSALDVHEGFRDGFPHYGGRLQPYLLRVPPGYAGADDVGLTFALHAAGSSYTQFAINAPNLMRQFGDQRNDVVVTPLGRGGSGWYAGEAEADFFEVWRDAARRFRLDSERVALTGYSMGGHGTYRLATAYPDLFGGAFTASAQPARGGWVPPAPPFDPAIGRSTAETNTNPLLENARWVPFLNWMQAADAVVPYAAAREQQQRFDALGLRSELWTFSPGEHFTTFFLLDEWGAARDHLGGARVKRDPSRVNYAFMPAADSAQLGLRHDHAHWVSDLRTRDTSGDPETNPARSEVNARSLAFGEGDPELRRVTSAEGGSAPPQVVSVEGTDWRGLTSARAKNELRVRLENIRRGTIAGKRARLRGDEPLRVKIDSDGEARIELKLPLPGGAVVRRVDASPDSDSVNGAGTEREVELNKRGATFHVAEGAREYEILPSAGDLNGSSTAGRFTRTSGPSRHTTPR